MRRQAAAVVAVVSAPPQQRAAAVGLAGRRCGAGCCQCKYCQEQQGWKARLHCTGDVASCVRNISDGCTILTARKTTPCCALGVATSMICLLARQGASMTQR